MFKLRLFLFFGVFLFIIGCSDDSENILQESEEMQIEKRQQWRPGNWWTPCEAENLVFFVDPCFTTAARADELAAINAAVANYNNVPGVGINITLVFSNPGPNGEVVDVTIDCNDALVGANGQVDATGGTLIEIDTNNPGTADCPVNVCFHTNTVMHEIGHILGFGHSQNGSDGVTIAGTSVTTNSVFVGGDCNSDICAFSNGDIIALRSQYPQLAIEGEFDICINETSTYCLDTDLDVQWTSPVNSTENCIEVTAGNFPSSILLSCTVSDNTGCVQEYTAAITVHDHEKCGPPSQPPYDFSDICIGEFRPVCYDFSGWDCLETISISSSSPKLIVDIDDLNVCLSYIWTKPTVVYLQVTFTNWCGDSRTTTWTINIVDCDGPIITDPPHDDPPNTGGPTAEDCSDFENPCPCDTVSDCPEGWKCIGGGSNKFCIEI